MRKIILSVILTVALLASVAWSLSSHKDYATMEIKDCNACHQSSGAVPNHGAFWMKEHRLYAEKYPNNCKDCHQQSFCLDCHQGGGIDRDLRVSTSGADYMPRTHRTDFREIHPIKAFDDPNKSCFRCHDAKAFCESCHSKFKRDDLRVLSHRRGFSDIELTKGGARHSLFNPAQCPTCHPNSLVPANQWSAGHAREARKNLTSCQTCHSDGQVCLKCHSAVSGLKVNPHPGNWGRIKNRLGRASDNRTCLKCHLTVP